MHSSTSLHASSIRSCVTALMGRPNHLFMQTPNGVVEVWAYADGYDDGGTVTASAAYFRIGSTAVEELSPLSSCRSHDERIERTRRVSAYRRTARRECRYRARM